MTDLQQFLIMMTKTVDPGNVSAGVSGKVYIEGDNLTTYVSFFQRGMNGKEVCDCIDKTNQEVTFMFNAKDGSFKGVEGAIK